MQTDYNDMKEAAANLANNVATDVKETASNVKDAAKRAGNGALAGVTREFNNVLVDIEHLIGETKSLTGTELTQAKKKISAQVTAAKTSVDKMSKALNQRAQKTAVSANAYARQQPWQTLGVGVALGLLAGMLLIRRAKRRADVDVAE